MKSDFKIGDRVIFKDEQNQTIKGKVVSLSPYGQNGRLGIEADKAYGIYVRDPHQVSKEVKK